MRAAIVYRDQIVRAMLGSRPAMTAQVADPAALERICERLAQCEEAHTILRAKRYGKPWMTIDEVAALVPEASNT